MMTLGKFSLGVGDRFAQQGQAQLRACLMALEHGVEIIPVWNKSNREHVILGSEPANVRAEADAAVRALDWTRPYFVDADHIGLKTVDRFMPHCDYFTIDVAEFIGKPAAPAAVQAFAGRHEELVGAREIPGLGRPFVTTRADVERLAGKYLLAVQEAAKVCRHLAAAKGAGTFVTEVSMDETDSPQTPPELLVILAALADEGVPAQAIAPKFSGRFNKGVDYAGDVAQFAREFNDDLAVIAHAVERYPLPPNLKLSVHSASDKFSLYPHVGQALRRFGAGVHLKTAGTTWLEEVIGLAGSGGEALALAKELYAQALARVDELCAPYASVIDIDRARLPSATVVNGWTAEAFVRALRHDLREPWFNPHLRQLLHVGYKVAAELGPRYLSLVTACRDTIARNVTHNLFARHIQPVFFAALGIKA
jgi:hypothetical protein